MKAILLAAATAAVTLAPPAATAQGVSLSIGERGPAVRERVQVEPRRERGRVIMREGRSAREHCRVTRERVWRNGREIIRTTRHCD